MKQEWFCCKECDRREDHGKVRGLSKWRRSRAKQKLRKETMKKWEEENDRESPG